jgi:hypothetical protein
LTGSEALSAAGRVRVLGRFLRFEGKSDAEPREEMSRGMPAAYVDDFFIGASYDESIHPTVHDVTGRPPRTFAVDHRTRGRVPMSIAWPSVSSRGGARYCVRSAVAGSTCVARRRGMSSAIVAQQTRIATATPSAMGSNGGTS